MEGLVLGSCLLTVIFCNPTTDTKPTSNVTQMVACLKVSDDILTLYLTMGCQVTNPQDPNECTSIANCPPEEPKDQEMSALWYAWKTISEEKNTTGQQDTPTIPGANEKGISESTTETTTTTKAATTSSISRVTRRRDCFRYRRSAVNLYREMGCTIEATRSCTVISDCPSECSDESGVDHKLQSDPWFEGVQKCTCENIKTVRSFVPRRPRGAPKFPPYKYCVTYGCIVPENDKYIKPNGQVARGNGIECVCREGPGPDVQDDAPPFHLDCVRVR